MSGYDNNPLGGKGSSDEERWAHDQQQKDIERMRQRKNCDNAKCTRGNEGAGPCKCQCNCHKDKGTGNGPKPAHASIYEIPPHDGDPQW